MRKIWKRITFVVVCMLLFAGCSSIPQQIFDKNKHSNIRIIALLDVPEPQEFSVINMGGVGMVFGLIGGLAQVADNMSKAEKFTHALKKIPPNISDDLKNKIKENLVKVGYKVKLLDGIRPKITENNTADYSDIKTDADAILDVWYVMAGYISPSGSFDYKPWVRINARMVSVTDKSQVYLQLFEYGEGLVSQEKVINFPEKDIHAYGNFEELIENSAEAKRALRNSAPAIAKGIANQL